MVNGRTTQIPAPTIEASWVRAQYARCLKQHPDDRSQAIKQLGIVASTRATELGLAVNDHFFSWVWQIVQEVNRLVEREQQQKQPVPPAPEAVPEIQFSNTPTAPSQPSLVVDRPGAIQKNESDSLLTVGAETLPVTKVNPYKEQGEQLALLFSRIQGINAKFTWIDCDYQSPRFVVHKIRDVDDGESPVFNPERLTGLGKLLKYKGFVPPGVEPAIIVRDGHIAIEIPKEHWKPISFKSVLKDAVKPTWDSPFLIWLGMDQRGQTVELNLSNPTGVHTLIGGANGGGKSILFNTIGPGSILRYQHLPGYLKFLFIDPHEVTFQFYDKLHPWFWDGRGIVSTRQEIADLFNFVGDDEEGNGALYAEYVRRKRLFIRARVDSFDAYIRKAIASEGRLPLLERIIVAQDETPSVVSLFGSKAGSTIKLWQAKFLKEYRKYGFHFIAAAQDPTADYDGAFDNEAIGQFGNRICLPCNRKEVVSERILGDGFKMGAKLTGPGDAYVLPAGVSEPIRTQIFYTPGELVDQLSSEVVRRYGEPVRKKPIELETSATSPSLLGDVDPDWEAWQRIQTKQLQANKRLNQRQMLITAFGHEYDRPEKANDGDFAKNKRRLDAILAKFGGKDNV